MRVGISGERNVRCACCGNMCDPGFLKQIAVVIAQRGATPWWAKSSDWIVESAQNGTLKWACMDCLGEDTVAQGRPWLQSFSDSPPLLAFYEQTCNCDDCGVSFAFSAQEQRFWYEDLKFWVGSHPNRCSDCRRHRRTERGAMRSMQEMLSTLDDQNPEQLAQVAGLYLGVGMMRKASEYLKRAKKLVSTEEEIADLLSVAKVSSAGMV